MIDPEVRSATPADAADLRDLEAEARAALVDARGGGRWLEDHPCVGGSWPVVVEGDGVFVAELSFGVDEPPLTVGYLVVGVDGAVARIEQVYVTPGARDLGFGDALLEAAVQAARAAGASVLEGEALPGDRQMKNLYERAKITARLIVVSTRLDRP